MEKFSDRVGVTLPKVEIQINKMDNDLRITLWNFLNLLFTEPTFHSTQWQKLLKCLYLHYFKLPINEIPALDLSCQRWLSEKFMVLPWYETYNLLQVVLNYMHTLDMRIKNEEVVEVLNILLERELSGYRVLNFQIIPISNKEELNSINETLQLTNVTKLRNINQHLNKALSLLSIKPIPDYHNSIKESISAVEGICKVLTKVESGGIKDALRILSEKIDIPAALQEGYEKIYGYTSGKDGIRHPLLSSRKITFAEAKYMLVSCSAFVNYIIDTARINNIL